MASALTTLAPKSLAKLSTSAARKRPEVIAQLAVFLGIGVEDVVAWLAPIHGRTKLSNAFGRLWQAARIRRGPSASGATCFGCWGSVGLCARPRIKRFVDDMRACLEDIDRRQEQAVDESGPGVGDDGRIREDKGPCGFGFQLAGE